MTQNLDIPAPATGAARPVKAVYMIIEREGRPAIWTRIGSGFPNRDGSTTMRLDAIPLSGTIQLRDAEPRNGGFHGGAQ